MKKRSLIKTVTYAVIILLVIAGLLFLAYFIPYYLTVIKPTQDCKSLDNSYDCLMNLSLDHPEVCNEFTGYKNISIYITAKEYVPSISVKDYCLYNAAINLKRPDICPIDVHYGIVSGYCTARASDFKFSNCNMLFDDNAKKTCIYYSSYSNNNFSYRLCDSIGNQRIQTGCRKNMVGASLLHTPNYNCSSILIADDPDSSLADYCWEIYALQTTDVGRCNKIVNNDTLKECYFQISIANCTCYGYSSNNDFESCRAECRYHYCDELEPESRWKCFNVLGLMNYTRQKLIGSSTVINYTRYIYDQGQYVGELEYLKFSPSLLTYEIEFHPHLSEEDLYSVGTNKYSSILDVALNITGLEWPIYHINGNNSTAYNNSILLGRPLQRQNKGPMFGMEFHPNDPFYYVYLHSPNNISDSLGASYNTYKFSDYSLVLAATAVTAGSNCSRGQVIFYIVNNNGTIVKTINATESTGGYSWSENNESIFFYFVFVGYPWFEMGMNVHISRPVALAEGRMVNDWKVHFEWVGINKLKKIVFTKTLDKNSDINSSILNEMIFKFNLTSST